MIRDRFPNYHPVSRPARSSFWQDFAWMCGEVGIACLLALVIWLILEGL